MPLFKKQESGQEGEPDMEKIIEELRTGEAETTEESQEEKPGKETKPKFITQKDEPRKDATLPRGTITISIIVDAVEFAKFTITPDIYSEATNMLKSVISNIVEPQLKLSTNCDCIWCREKIKELQRYLTE